ncbi:asparagine synthase (glutamine-hydrolysing) [Cohnella sp. SGD-V74]|uniref:asparagine synthase (glutamine-hydrolyzing) n=1 Tax=unclassified Cohnella TaxID=2636738 RepID=UPI000D4AE2F0|nr:MULTISPECIES: asparagine synthase (glutamine-hydrolyzing) [unclassified Cohnella]PRX67130.1 asparagine synthase (glutamine-hydrolysing) [Cohnella sp. SGD-V74]
MCGIVGIYDITRNPIDENNLIKMRDVLTHRGPNDSGIYTDHNFGLGFRRLSIIDLENGHQPMTTVDGRYTIAFNGEIYNHVELRHRLIADGHTFITKSDTEVLLQLFLQKGSACLQDLNGMFAFAVWDSKTKELFFARDRIGIKPFYYYFDNSRFIFASEIKAIIADASIPREPNYEAISDYLHYMYIPDEKTFFHGINKLLPGHFGTLNLHKGLTISEYWDVDYTIKNKSEKDYIIELKNLLTDSIRLQLRSDVQIGCHLSGGLDSSTVSCLSSNQTTNHMMTFTGKFNESKYFDETKYAKIVANFASTNYIEVSPEEGYYRTVLPRLIWHMDEPCAGPGMIPQFLVSEKASNHVRVILGGQGGDELFGGYNRYYVSSGLKSQKLAPKIISRLRILRNNINQHGIKRTIQKLRNTLKNQVSVHLTFNDIWAQINTRIDRTHPVISNKFKERIVSYDSKQTFLKYINKKQDLSTFNKMLYHDLKSYLPALLHVEDRTSMAVSLESRVPLLDHRIVELAATIPLDIKVKHDEPKYILKKAVKGIIPKEIISRKDKKGFPTPIEFWMRNDKELLENILLDERSTKRGLFNPEELKRLINSGNQPLLIWMLLNVELWFRIFIDSDVDFTPSDGSIMELCNL